MCARAVLKPEVCLFLNARVDQIVGKSPKADGEAGDDLSMMGRLVKVEKQVLIFLNIHEHWGILFES